jgi:hypothetical protein
MQVLSNGAVAIVDAGAAHGRTAVVASAEIDGVSAVAVGRDATRENPDILIPESNA